MKQLGPMDRGELPWFRLLLMLCVLVTSRVTTAGDDVRAKSAFDVQLQRARDGISALQAWYDPVSGLYKTTGWWNSANAITVLVDYSRLANSGRYTSVFSNTFTAAQGGKEGSKGFINKFYDDEGWWALAWIDAYDLTRDPRYLSMAESIFADMTTGWDDVCDGGVWWNKDRRYKGAIENELFLSVAAHLANRSRARRAQYLDWANKEWTWFSRSGMISAQNLINDGLGTHDGKTPASACRNNGLPAWTYNQGVVLGGLAELSKLNSDSSLSQAAQRIASAAITLLVDSNCILHDPCEPKCGADGVQFKGIFVRNLAALYMQFPRTAWKVFILNNANAIWDKSQGPGCRFGQVWSGPFDAANAGSQSAALDAINAASEVE